MQKTRINGIITILIIFISGILTFTIPVSGDPGLEYGPVSYTLSTNSQEVPQIYIKTEYVYDDVNLVNLSTGLDNNSFVIIDHSTDKHVKNGLLDYDSGDDSFSKLISLADVPEGDYYFALDFDSGTDSNYTEFYADDPFTVEHTIYMDYSVVPSSDLSSFSIDLQTSPTYTGYDALNDTNCVIKYHLKKGNIQVKEDTLNYVSENEFEANGINLKGFGSGTFYVWLELDCNYLSETITTEDVQDAIGHSFTRSAPLEDILTWIILVAVVVILVVVGALIYARRGAGRVEKRTKKKEDEVIEVLDLKKSSATHLDTNRKKKKQKGKTEVNKDLIFSVPQWEEEDLEAEKAAADFNIEESIDEAPNQYTMHCSECDSWYEVDDLVELDCPKCGVPLSLAMYCPNDEKWFEVPDAGAYDCPKCSGPLRYSK